MMMMRSQHGRHHSPLTTLRQWRKRGRRRSLYSRLRPPLTVDPPETAWRIEFLWYIMILYRLRVLYFVSQVNTILCIKWKIHLIRSSNNFYHFSWHSFISFTEGGNDRQLDIDISQVKLGVLFREKKYLLCLSVCPVHRKTLNVIKSCYQVNWLSDSSV